MEADEANDSEPARSGGTQACPLGAQEVKKGALERASDYELWFSDSVRFDLLPVVTYTYRKRGEPLRIPTPGTNVKVAVSGALRWPDGPFHFSHGGSSVNTALFMRMLETLERRARQTRKRMILVLDNGPEHTSWLALFELERLSDVLRVFWLPSYTSETLQYLEGIWKHLEEDYFSRMLVRSPKTFTRAVVRLLSGLRRAKALRRMLRPRHPKPMSKNLLTVA